MRAFIATVGLAVGAWMVVQHLRRADAANRKVQGDDERRDAMLEDSFPASDPPSLGGVS